MTNIQQSGSVRWEWDAEGVVTVTLDDPGRTANMLNRRHHDGLRACLDDLDAHRDRLRGMVLTSAKRSFVAGPEFEPGEITPEEAASTYDLLVPLRDQARRLETLGRPVAAALNGSALGGGFELALACHHRVGPDDPSVVWSLAETGMGIMPGGGGTVRVTRMAGITATVLDIVGPGTAFHPRAALAAGLVDELADDVVAAARAWVLAQPAGPFIQRWERPGYRIPGGTAEPPGLAEEVRRRSEGSPVRALRAVLDVAVRSAGAPPDEAFEIETAAFRTLLGAPEIPALSHLFFAMRRVAGTATPAYPVATTAGVHEFPQRVAHPLAAVFFAPDAPVVEIAGDAPARMADEVRARGGIPVVTSDGTTSFVQALLDAGPDPAEMAAAARRALDAGLVVDPAGADVASVLAAGFPPWTGGVLHHLAAPGVSDEGRH
ncbi:enoyl-CoA hydratase/isomerase family protein [Micromonospora humi]|uniref:3-hydroxyacyl-CoA dehydrogenase / enoyl-CoA hydratase / 3-hydroxybutyryl-CoA epimerase n=1 Tax=Micromonospora humi TaxID=745366 RepID=A0A1C5JQB2_9ACTN|nr:enoyl-CoA hydratase/isomerase family protein [Micromonospora humi]SCG72775.1 3-hydroxyacyl-CoA dehydrogenase / enoyl-CoA hydratase / 3-hydroxybutyryl-CoA epimerase [Micromonospora humi]